MALDNTGERESAKAVPWKKELFLTLLMLCLLLLFGYWQVSDHLKLRREREKVLSLMERDISISIARILNAPPKFGPISIKSSVTEKINRLMESSKGTPLKAVAFLNAEGGVILNVTAHEAPGNWIGKGASKRLGRFKTIEKNCSELFGSAGSAAPRPVTLGNSEDVMEMMNLVSSPVLHADGVSAPPDSGLAAARMKEALKTGKFKTNTIAKIVCLVEMGFMRDAISHDMLIRSISLAFCLLAFGIFTASLFNLNRNVKLKILLAKEKEENLHAQETRLMAAGLAHDIKNPLHLVRGVAQSIAEATADSDTMEKASLMIDEVDRVTSRLNKFMAYSNPTPIRREMIDLARTVEGVATILEADCEERNIKLDIDVPEMTVEADKQALEQIIFNLAHNAIKAVGKDGNIAVSVKTGRMGRKKVAAIEVVDDGPGVPEDAVENIFKPYFTLSPSGTGLGLAVVKRLCEKQGWTIEYIDKNGKGAIFRVGRIKMT